MANLPQQNTIVQSVADGISTDYIVPFFVPIDTDGTPNIDVYVQDANAPAIPANDIQTWNVNYTYTPNLDPISGGTVVFLLGSIPANGYVVTIVRNVSVSLNVEFANATTFSGITLDNALQKLLLINQQTNSYALDRNLSYIVNSYIPNSELMANVQIPVLQANEIWIGSANGVVAAVLEQNPDVSTLRGELANQSPGTDGATLVGYYDSVNVNPTTVDAQLTLLTSGLVAAIPTGMILDFGGISAPAGFLECDGTIELIATYPNLYAAIGNIWGGDGITTFARPNLQRKTTIGSGGTVVNAIIGNTVGDSGGEELHTMTIAEMVSHDHPSSRGGVVVGVTGISAGVNPLLYGSSNTYDISVQSQGSSTPFNVIQPSAVVLKCIKT